MTAFRGPPEKLYRIGEVMEHTGLSRQTLHFYATLGLIREKRRTASGYRLFPAEVFRDLDRVRRLQRRGKTLREIRDVLQREKNPRARPADQTRTHESPQAHAGPPATGPHREPRKE